ncbi:MAG: carbamoyltransferase [Dehalococcoidales bacterium]|nr:carbamoyltransferase [Dehalococcoidales bacterium]
MYILGISCFYHDSAAAILKDGIILAAAEEERFSRIKHDSGFPRNAVDFCLEFAGISSADLDYVVFYEKPFQKFERILMTTLQSFPRSWTVFSEAMSAWISDRLWVKSTIRDKLGIEDSKILFTEHHLSHAASTFYPSGFDEAAILTIDGVGEWTTASIGRGKGTEIKLLKEIRFPHSLGLLYSAFTAFLGFQVNEGEYKVMGMAPYGEPRYTDKIYNELIRVDSDGSFSLNMDYFCYHYSDTKMFNARFENLFGTPRPPEQLFFTTDSGFPSYFGEKPSNYAELCKDNEYYADVAASIQKVTEEIVLKLVDSLYEETGLENLCLAGGVGLNSVANGRILRESRFKNIFIQPAAGDGGGALGAALHAWHGLLGNPRQFTMEHAYLGKEYSEDEIRDFLETNNISYEYYPDEDSLTDKLVESLVQGKVIGLFQGRFEWGPRALGNRSILADPRSEEMKDLVNVKIKFREPFRPFAPVILEDRVEDFFEDGSLAAMQYPSRYMLMVLPVKRENGDRIKAVNHGGTGRLQTLREEWNPRYYNTVKKFGEATGVPVLLNTSFNLRGEPIVTTPANAFNTFSKSGIDMLVLEKFIISK